MENKKVNFNKKIKDLDGKEIVGAEMNKLLANELATKGKGDAIKLWGWALNLQEGKELFLDYSDFNFLKDFIENSEFPVITKAQMLLVINE